MPEIERRWGWFSPAFKDTGLNTSIYATLDGGEVEVCWITRSPVSYPGAAGWLDAVPLGELGEWLRVGQPGYPRVTYYR